MTMFWCKKCTRKRVASTFERFKNQKRIYECKECKLRYIKNGGTHHNPDLILINGVTSEI